MKQLKLIWKRLRKPSVILSLVSQVTALCLLLGFQVNESLVMTIATSICAILVTLGILSNPDTVKRGYQDDVLDCPQCGKLEKHVLIDGKMVCTECGTACQEAIETTDQE